MAQMLASPRHGAEIQVLRVRLAVDIVASGVGDEAQLGLRPARGATTSGQDWKRAASVNSARTPNSSIRRKIGSQAGTVSLATSRGAVLPPASISFILSPPLEGNHRLPNSGQAVEAFVPPSTARYS